MKTFDDKEKQVQEICDRVRNSDFFDAELKIAYYDIIKIVREAYYEGHDAGVQRLSEIQAKNQDLINNLFKH